MRNKIYSFLTLLLLLVSAQGSAQITDLSQLSNSKAYTLTCSRGSLTIGRGRLASTYDSDYTGFTEASTFAILQSGGSYYLYSVEGKCFINSSGQGTNYGTLSAATLTAQSDNKFLLCIGGNGVNTTWTSDYTAMTVNSWTTADDGNQYTITEASDFDPTEALAVLASPQTAPTTTALTALSGLSNSKAYNIYNARGMWTTSYPFTSISAAITSGASIATDGPGMQFGIIQEDGYYFIYNVTAGGFLNSDKSFSSTPQAVDISTTGDSSYPFYFKFDDSHVINGGTTFVLIDTWTTQDDGNKNTIVEVADADLTDAVNAVHAYLHPTSITYTVNLHGLTTATVTIGGTAYHDGDTFTRTSAITSSDVTVSLPVGYGTSTVTVATEGEERTITVDFTYDFSGKTRLADPSALTATKGYVLNNIYGTGILAADAEDGTLTLRNLAQSSHSVTSDKYRYPYVASKKNHVWQILTEDDNYYIYNPGQEQFMYWNESYYAMTAQKTPLYVTAVDSTTTIVINGTTTEIYHACAATQFSSSPIRWWYADSSDSQWEIMESDFTNLPDTRTYTIRIEGFDEDVMDPDDEFYLASVGFAWSDFYHDGTEDKVKAYILLDADDVELPTYAGYRSSVTVEGNAITITYSGTVDLEPLQTALATAQQYPLGTSVGQYTASSDVLELLSSAIAAAEEYLAADEVPLSDLSNVNAVVTGLQTAVAALTLNMPQTGKYYRFKAPHVQGSTYTAESGNYYMSAEGDGSTNLNSLSNVADATNIFYLTEDYKLLSYYHPTYLKGGTTDYNATYLADAGDTDAFTLTFSEGTEVGSYQILLSETTYLYNWYYSWSGLSVLVLSDNSDIRTQWYLEEVTELPVALTEVEENTYSTLYLPVPVQVSGATVYVPTFGDGTFTLTEVADGIVPAQTAVILKGTEAEATATITTTAKTLASALTGTIASIPTEDVATPYVFSYRNGVLGFFRYVGSVLTGNKAYYSNAAANVEGFAIDWDNLTDGLNLTPALSQGEGAVYDLTGRQMVNGQMVNGKWSNGKWSNGTLPRGLYIQNGKKYIVK